MEYTFRPITTGSILFKVQSPSDAHIALASGPAENEPMYEVRANYFLFLLNEKAIGPRIGLREGEKWWWGGRKG